MSEVVEIPKFFCRFCRHEIPARDAQRCNACSAYQQGLRRWLPLSTTVQIFGWLAAIVTAIVGAVPFVITQWTNFETRNSKTFIDFAGSDTRGDAVFIYAHLWNSGRQPSTIGEYHLKKGPVDALLLPVADAKHEVRSIVNAQGEFTIPLLVLGVQARGSATYDNVIAALPTQAATLCAVVKESDGSPAHCAESPPFQAELLRDVIQRRMRRNQ
jgi:hypothetical protein